MNVSRRWFIGGAVSFGALGGSRIFASDGFRSGCPNLTLGVLSDIHVRCRARPGEKISHLQNELTFIHALEWFRDQGVDGVVLPGDMSDNGSVELLTVVADAWFRVFPNGRAPDGRPVEQLFVYGNHDMLRAKHLRGMYKGLTDEQLKPYAISTNPKAAWEKALCCAVHGDINGNRIALFTDGAGSPRGVRYLYSRPWYGSVYNEVNLPLGAFTIGD